MTNKSEGKASSNTSWIIILLIGAIAWYALYAYTKNTKANHIQASLQQQSQTLFKQFEELANVAPRVDGRDAVLSGSVPAEAWQHKAFELISNINGIRSVQNNIVIAVATEGVNLTPEAMNIKAKLDPIPQVFNPLNQAPTKADLTLQEAEKNLAQIDMRRISFEDGSAAISTEASGPLNVVAKTLLDFPTIYLFVIGYADPGVNPDLNLEVSTRRAQLVADYIIAKGVHYSRVAAQGFGDYAPSETDTVRLEDQRIEFQLINGE